MKKFVMSAVLSAFFMGIALFSYADNTASSDVVQLNNQIQAQIKQIQSDGQKQIETLNSQLQAQIKQMQTTLEGEIQQLAKTTQSQLQTAQANLEKEISQLQSQMVQVKKP